MNLIRLSDHFRKSGQFIALFTIDTMILTILLLCYMPDSNIVQSMDFMGWIYYISSCFSHAAIIAAGIFIVFYGVPALFHKYRLATILTTIIVSILSALILLNLQVFRIYHFHINGLILNMVFGSGAGEIFTFDTMVYVKEIISLLFIFAIITAGAFLSYRFQKIKFKIIFFLILGTLLLANGIHVYGAFYQKTSVIKSTRLIPYYFPLSLIMATLNQPDILLLDEHTAALDPQTSEIILEKTREIVEKNNITSLMITHNMQDAIKYGNRLIMLHAGEVIFDIRDSEKKLLTVEKLLEMFKKKDAQLSDKDVF